jgi:CPA2 family monovalent cation:H+ antiporter-2
MPETSLPQVLILIAASVFVVALARRLGLPAILGYVAVGLALGPFALGVLADSSTTRILGELGVVFLLFTLGLEFSWPRMVAMRREVFGLGTAQVVFTAAITGAIAHALGVPLAAAVVVGGAIAMSSTVLIVQQLTESAELNRTHGRLAFSVVLFQDLAFVPFLALAASLAAGASGEFSLAAVAIRVGAGTLAVLVVLAAGRWLLRPLFYEIAHSRLRELFTLTVLLVALASAWASHLAGLSMALGAFVAGMMLAETEYRHQVESVIRPFRDILLGLFFISVGMLLDVRLLVREFWTVSAILVGFLILKALVASLATRAMVDSNFKALRTGITLSIGGEFGVALMTLMLQSGAIDARFGQPILVAIVLGMVLAPVIMANNKRIARAVLGERGPRRTALEREEEATNAVAQREHVIVCGFGRVGQNIGRVLETQGFEFIAIDLDPARIRAARQAGNSIVYGDSADEEVLERVGLDAASAVVITFANPAVSVGILRSIRRLRPTVPVLVRTQDDLKLTELKDAGATEVIPETFEASLMLTSHVLMILGMPVGRVVRVVGDLRENRYEMLRDVIADDGDATRRTADDAEQTRSIVLPPGAWAVGRSLDELRAAGAEVVFTAVRRQGIVGREPSGDTLLRNGDIVIVYGTPAALEHAEAVMLAG